MNKGVRSHSRLTLKLRPYSAKAINSNDDQADQTTTQLDSNQRIQVPLDTDSTSD